MSWKHFDAVAAKLQKICDRDSRDHGGRSSGDEISERIEYFDLCELLEGYWALRDMHKAMRKFIPLLIDFAETEMWNDGKAH